MPVDLRGRGGGNQSLGRVADQEKQAGGQDHDTEVVPRSPAPHTQEVRSSPARRPGEGAWLPRQTPRDPHLPSGPADAVLPL